MSKNKQRIPFICNFCGGKLMFYNQFEVAPKIREQLKEIAGIKGDEAFKIQKCVNPDCGRTYIWIEPKRGA